MNSQGASDALHYANDGQIGLDAVPPNARDAEKIGWLNSHGVSDALHYANDGQVGLSTLEARVESTAKTLLLSHRIARDKRESVRKSTLKLSGVTPGRFDFRADSRLPTDARLYLYVALFRFSTNSPCAGDAPRFADETRRRIARYVTR